MKSTIRQTLAILMGVVAVVIAAFRPSQEKFGKISVREFELVDEQGKERASIKVEVEGTVVLRLRDKTGVIRVKLAADEGGSGLVLMDDKTEPAIHALSNKDGSTLTLLGKDGKKRQY